MTVASRSLDLSNVFMPWPVVADDSGVKCEKQTTYRGEQSAGSWATVVGMARIWYGRPAVL